MAVDRSAGKWHSLARRVAQRCRRPAPDPIPRILSCVSGFRSLIMIPEEVGSEHLEGGRYRSMGNLPRTPRSRLRLVALALCLLVLASLAWRKPWVRPLPTARPSDPMPDLFAPEASRAEVERTCGTCHAFPSPELFPKDGWPREVERGFHFLAKSPTPVAPGTPSFASVVSYYYHRAPEELPALERAAPSPAGPARFQATGYRSTHGNRLPGIAYVRFVHLSDARKLDVLACDMMSGSHPVAEAIRARGRAPGRDRRCPQSRRTPRSLTWMAMGSRTSSSPIWDGDSPRMSDSAASSGPGPPDGSFRPPLTLAGGLGRVADVQVADFDGDGDRDLIVAEFGWLDTGSIRLLENRRATPSDRPSSRRRWTPAMGRSMSRWPTSSGWPAGFRGPDQPGA